MVINPNIVNTGERRNTENSDLLFYSRPLAPILQSKNKVTPCPDLQGIAPIQALALFLFLLLLLCFYPSLFLRSLPLHFLGNAVLPQESDPMSLGLFLKTSRVCGERTPLASLLLGREKDQLQILKAEGRTSGLYFVVFSMNLRNRHTQNKQKWKQKNKKPSEKHFSRWRLMSSQRSYWLLFLFVFCTQVSAYFAIGFVPELILGYKMKLLWNGQGLSPRLILQGEAGPSTWPCLSPPLMPLLLSLCTQTLPHREIFFLFPMPQSKMTSLGTSLLSPHGPFIAHVHTLRKIFFFHSTNENSRNNFYVTS